MQSLPLNSSKFTKLEAIRGFAAVYVAIHHTVGKSLIIGHINIANIFRFGQEAVILFFILSGIVIRYSFEKSRDKSFYTYFLKRFLRIYIPLILVFITNYFLFSFVEGKFVVIDILNFIGNILMLQDSTQTKPNVLVSTFLGNQPLWSLSYEWWFYMIFFIIYSLFKRRATQIVYLFSIIAAATYIIYPTFANRIFLYLSIWWLGSDIAQIYIDKREISVKKLIYPLSAICICIVFLVLNVVLNSAKIETQLHDKGFGISPMLELRHFVVAVIFVLIAIYWRKANWFGFNWTVGLFEKFAPISYVFYISHYFLISRAHYLDKVFFDLSTKYLLYVIICLIFSYLVERIIYLKLSKFILVNINKKFFYSKV